MLFIVLSVEPLSKIVDIIIEVFTEFSNSRTKIDLRRECSKKLRLIRVLATPVGSVTICERLKEDVIDKSLL